MEDREVHLVTGSHGHIGSYIVEYLAKTRKCATIICVDNMYNGSYDNLIVAYDSIDYNKNRILEYGYSISNLHSMNIIFEKHKPQYVYHQASMLTLDSKKDRKNAIQYNVVGFANILELCTTYAVKKLVFASSASVFGDPDNIPTDETHNFENCSLLYGATKVCNEYLAHSYATQEGLDFVGLRYFNVYGARQSTKNVYTQIVPKWINAFIDKKPITIYGDGSQTMDMIHGQDVGRLNVEAMMNLVLKSSTEFRGFINVGTGIETSVYDLYNIIRTELEAVGIEVHTNIFYEEHDPALVKKRCCNTNLMNTLLGTHEIDVKTGIAMTVKEILKKRNA